MSKTIKEQMRVLVKEHERGLLPKDDYRRLRSALLERAMQGKTDAPDEPTHTRPRQPIAPDKPVIPPTVTAPRKASLKANPAPRPAPETKVPVPAEPGRSKAILLGAAAAGLLVLAGAYMFFKNDPAQPDSELTAAPSAESRESDSIDRLIDDFIQEKDWSPGSVRRFARDWSDLEPQIRGRAKTTSSYREFARELRDRLKLSEQSSTEATTASLRELAQSLELRVDSRFVVADIPEPEEETPNPVRAKTTNDTAISDSVARKPEPNPGPVTETIDTLVVSKANPEIIPPVPQKQTVVVDVSGTNTQPDSGKVVRSTTIEPVKVVNPRKNEVKPAVELSGETKTATAPKIAKADSSVIASSTAQNDSVDLSVVKNNTSTSPVATPKETRPAQVSGSRGSQCSSSVLKTRRKFCRDQLLDGSEGPKLALIRTGSFLMGSTARHEEQPVHQVEVDKAVAIGVNEVSYAEFIRYCQATGSKCPENPWGEDNLPVVNVTWSQARQYTAWLSAQSGATYRLPTEAEWEYAARAGTETAYPFGEKISYLQAHFSGTKQEDRPKPVDGSLVLSNEFGLKHIVGNVSEWVEDAWTDDYSRAPANAQAFTGQPGARRVVRGGSYHDRATDLRSAARSSLAADEKAPYTGFRIAREIQ